MVSVFKHYLGDPPAEIKKSFDDLPRDEYASMGERNRRLSRVLVSAKGKDRSLRWSHDATFYQDRQINNRNGGIQRIWLPIETYVAESLWLRQTICDLSDILNVSQEITFEVHQFRVLCSSNLLGHPAPEGPHQDGRRYVAIAHINQDNVDGGVTQLYKGLGEPAFLQDRLQPGDLLVFDDTQYFHFTTPIKPLLPDSNKGFRDVFIFTVPFQN